MTLAVDGACHSEGIGRRRARETSKGKVTLGETRTKKKGAVRDEKAARKGKGGQLRQGGNFYRGGWREGTQGNGGRPQLEKKDANRTTAVPTGGIAAAARNYGEGRGKRTGHVQTHTPERKGETNLSESSP